MLTGLLDKDQQARLKLQDLRKQAWFADIDWAALAEQRLPAPRLVEMEVRAALRWGRRLAFIGRHMCRTSTLYVWSMSWPQDVHIHARVGGASV